MKLTCCLREKALPFAISYVRSLPPSKSQAASLDVIASALRIPNYFDFDAVLRVESVQAVKTHGLFALLTIFTRKGLDELKAWIGRNKALLNEYRKCFT